MKPCLAKARQGFFIWRLFFFFKKKRFPAILRSDVRGWNGESAGLRLHDEQCFEMEML